MSEFKLPLQYTPITGITSTIHTSLSTGSIPRIIKNIKKLTLRYVDNISL